MSHRKTRVAIVGAGIAGLAAAALLRSKGVETLVIDKARGAGGRTATRRDGELRFDHGAQYFTCRHDDFGAAVQRWLSAGLIQRWEGQIVSIGVGGEVRPTQSDTTRYVGIPGMNAMCRHMAKRVDCIFRTRVVALRHDIAWRLTLDNGVVVAADDLILSLPPGQSATLLEDIAPTFFDRLREVNMRPCWAAMLALSRPLETDFVAAFVNHGPLSWIAHDSSKPGRTTRDCWVLHASEDYSERHIDADADAVAAILLGALCEISDQPVDPLRLIPHRWLYARAAEPLRSGFLHDRDARLFVTGDWCAGSRIEGAYLSGRAAARAVLAEHGAPAY